mmetsp:Transcript_6582/g.20663  ORF Transcript_6582/g.20663 Transcript_6582/m.20663 type:complete len:214 (+) Transcript_6582:286-927(+)
MLREAVADNSTGALHVCHHLLERFAEREELLVRRLLVDGVSREGLGLHRVLQPVAGLAERRLDEHRRVGGVPALVNVRQIEDEIQVPLRVPVGPFRRIGRVKRPVENGEFGLWVCGRSSANGKGAAVSVHECRAVRRILELLEGASERGRARFLHRRVYRDVAAAILRELSDKLQRARAHEGRTVVRPAAKVARAALDGAFLVAEHEQFVEVD